jgi:glutamate-ammonia-ligase adenylyltransferase
MGRLLVAARLLAPEGQQPPKAARTVLARACGCGDWDELLAALTAARQTVASTWSATFEQKLEIDA